MSEPVAPPADNAPGISPLQALAGTQSADQIKDGILSRFQAFQAGEPPPDVSEPHSGTRGGEPNTPPGSDTPPSAKPAVQAKPGVPEIPMRKSLEPEPEKLPQPPAPPKDDGIDLNKVPRRTEEWAAAKEKVRQQARAEMKAEVEAIQAQLAEAKKNSESGDVAKYQKELAEAKNALRAVAIERDPEFNKEFQDRITKVTTNLSNFFDEEQVAKIVGTMKMAPGKERNVAIREMTSSLLRNDPNAIFNANLIMSSLSAWDDAHAGRQAKIAESVKNFDSFQAQQRAQVQAEQAQREEQFEKIFKAEVQGYTDKGYDFFNEKAGADSERRLATARYMVTGSLTPQEMAQTALLASLAPDLIGENIRLQQQLEDALRKVGAVRNGSPGLGRDVSGSRPESSKPTMKTTTELAEHTMRMLQDAGHVGR